MDIIKEIEDGEENSEVNDSKSVKSYTKYITGITYHLHSKPLGAAGNSFSIKYVPYIREEKVVWGKMGLRGGS